MIKKGFIVIAIILLLITSYSALLSIRDIQAKVRENQAPPANLVKFVYIYGGSPQLEKSNMSIFIEDIISKTFKLEEVERLDSYEPLENATVLLLLGHQDFKDIDLGVIREFLMDGGSLLIALPEENYTLYNDILKLFSYEILGPVIDNTSYFEENTTIVVNSSQILIDHPIAHSMFGNVSKLVIPKAFAIRKTDEPALINATFVDYIFAWGSNTSFADENNNGKYDPDEAIGRNVSLIICIELWYGGKIVILPSVSMLADDYLSLPQFDNLFLAYSLTYWLGNQINYISIRDVNVEPQRVNLDEPNPHINVSCVITDENGEIIPYLNVTVFVTRLRIILKSQPAERIANSSVYKAQINVSSMKKGIVIILIMAYKKYYGYHWAGGVEVQLFKQPVKLSRPDPILLTFGLILPISISILAIIYVYPEYREKKAKLRELEEKIKKK